LKENERKKKKEGKVLIFFEKKLGLVGEPGE
jgi:hypothetical protein